MLTVKLTPHNYSYVESIIISSIIDNPKDWDINDCHCDNAKLKVHIWIGNGRGHLEVKIDGHLVIGGFALIPIAPWRYRLWRVIQQSKSLRTLERISQWVEAAQ